LGELHREPNDAIQHDEESFGRNPISTFPEIRIGRKRKQPHCHGGKHVQDNSEFILDYIVSFNGFLKLTKTMNLPRFSLDYIVSFNDRLSGFLMHKKLCLS
jgi:hypothetical protein